MTIVHKLGLSVVIICGGLSILWGCLLGWRAYEGPLDFQAIYYGARTLIEHHNPYSISELESVYQAKSGDRRPIGSKKHDLITLFVNTPGTVLLVAPIAALPLGVAQALWMVLTAGSVVLACVLLWGVAAEHASGLSTCLIGFLLLNCQVVIAAGNTAAIVVGLCAIAAWCFVRDRFVIAGVLCMVISVAIKPHDSGLVLFYFLLAGSTYRKRALQSAILVGIICLAAVVWLSSIAPHWLHDWQSNLALISAPGGMNDPRPTSVASATAPGNVISLQAIFSIFSDSPGFFNLASYTACGAIMLPWMAVTLRARISESRAWFALAVIAPLTMLITYHRVYDAKLLMLCIPACAMLWAMRGRIGVAALVLTSLGVILNADIPLAIYATLLQHAHLSTSTISGKILTILIARPNQLVLLAMSLFYLWVYAQKHLVSIAQGDPQYASQTADLIDAPDHARV